jgi:AcrR family transcriptional regulator
MSTESAAPELTARERRRMRTMAAIQQAALELFVEQGYEATTVEQIAQAADISPATFFRYYPSKEDVVRSDEYDGMLTKFLVERPPEEDVYTAVRETMRRLAPLLEQAGPDLLRRARLLMSTPGLRAQMWEAEHANQELLAEVIAPRMGRSATDFTVRVTAASITSAAFTAVLDWVDTGGAEPLNVLFQRALDVIDPARGPDRT